jgi:lipoprotein-releasing system permease protein
VAAPDRPPVPLLPDSVLFTARVVSGRPGPKVIRPWEPLAAQMEASGFFTAVCPVAEGPAFAVKGEKTSAVIIRGAPLPALDSVYQISRRMMKGAALLNAGGVLIGVDLARELRLKPGDTFRLTSPGGASDIFTVNGVFDLEVKALNSAWVVMALNRAAALLSLEGSVTAIEARVPAVFEAGLIAAALKKSFPALEWTSWQESNAALLAALKSQSHSSNLIQVMVLLAVTLGIASVLAVSAIQKSRQIGILKAMGADSRTIGLIFILMGFMLGVTGSALGCLGGYGLITGFLKGTAAATGRPLFPLAVDARLFVTSILVATAAGGLAAFVPARRSAALNPIEVIRNG